MSLPPTEKKRLAKTFLEEIWPDIEKRMDQQIIAGFKSKTLDPEDAKNTYLGIDLVKTALRQFTTLDRD